MPLIARAQTQDDFWVRDVIDAPDFGAQVTTVSKEAGRYAENVVIGFNCRVEIGWNADFTMRDQPDAVDIVDD